MSAPAGPLRLTCGVRREQAAALNAFAARVRAVKQWPGLPVSANGRHPVWGAATGSNQQRHVLLDNLMQVSAFHSTSNVRLISRPGTVLADL